MASSWSEARRRAELVAAGAALARRGLIRGVEGNLSCRLGRTTILITRRGANLGRLAASDLVFCELGASSVAMASSELPVHTTVYASIKGIGALVHAHPAAVLALDASGRTPDPSLLIEAERLVGCVARTPALPPGSVELAEACVAALREAPVAVLARHGVLAAGHTVDEALLRAELVELIAGIMLGGGRG